MEKIIRPTSAQVELLIIKTCWVVQVKIFLSNHRALGYCARELKEKTSFENGFIDGEAGVQPNWSYDSINGERAVQRKTIRDRRSYRLISRLQIGVTYKEF